MPYFHLLQLRFLARALKFESTILVKELKHFASKFASLYYKSIGWENSG